MKLTVDMNDPADVQKALALLGGGAPAAVPTPAPAAPGAPPAPTPPAAPAPAAPPPSPAPAPAAAPAPAPAAPPAPTPAAPSGDAAATTGFQAKVNDFAKKYGAKACKARFAEVSTALNINPAWGKTSDIPVAMYPQVEPWFAVQ